MVSSQAHDSQGQNVLDQRVSEMLLVFISPAQAVLTLYIIRPDLDTLILFAPVCLFESLRGRNLSGF